MRQMHSLLKITLLFLLFFSFFACEIVYPLFLITLEYLKVPQMTQIQRAKITLWLNCAKPTCTLRPQPLLGTPALIYAARIRLTISLSQLCIIV